jgi:GH15 family glucan-1,4-alpha-glucosidase
LTRDLPLGNGRLLVDFDLAYNLSDVYYDHAGQPNQANGRVSIFGAWTADEGLSWLGEGWQIERHYRPQAYVTEVQAVQSRLQVGLQINDALPTEPDVLLRRVVVRNLAAEEREVRLFWHIDLDLAAPPFASTALYHPETRSLIVYKGHVWFLLCGFAAGEPAGLTQFSVGNKGTYRDAEDGQLDSNPIATGDVDAVGGLSCRIPAGGSCDAYFWILVAPGLDEVIAGHRRIALAEPGRLIDQEEAASQEWLSHCRVNYALLPELLATVYAKSLLVIQSAFDRGGAIIASPDSTIARPSSDTYQYAWPRDGALVAHALDLAGYPDESHRFYRFCAEALSGSFPWLWQKYNPDGSRGSTWHAIYNPNMRALQMQMQEDETALAIWALAEHARYCPGECVGRLYDNWARNVADWLAVYHRADQLPRPSFNLWEEQYGIWSFTAGTVIAALESAAGLANQFGTMEEGQRYRGAAQAMRQAVAERLYDEELGRFITGLELGSGEERRITAPDASLFGLWAFGAFDADDPRIVRTMEAVERQLWLPTEVGGVARYPGDRYYRRDAAFAGNPWIITTLWLAQWHIAVGHQERALQLLQWAAGRALPSGILAEQVDPHTGAPLSVSPLIWSHSTYVLAVHQYLNAKGTQKTT